MPVTINGSDGITNASWTTGTRPSNPAAGQMGYNADISNFEIYNGSDWVNITDIANNIANNIVDNKLSKLLVQVPGAAAAYSLRRLTLANTAVVRVRKDSDNTEQDFRSEEIEDGSLETFCGSSDGLVTTWYDQSGNGNDATQTTASDQPKIVSAGVLVTENGRPAIDFTNTKRLLLSDALNTSTFNTMFEVFKTRKMANPINNDLRNGHYLIEDGLNDTRGTFLPLETNSSMFINNEEQLNPTNNDIFDNSSSSGLTIITSIGIDFTAQAGGQIGHTRSDRSAANVSEIIVYTTDQSSNRESIETNINNYYGVF